MKNKLLSKIENMLSNRFFLECKLKKYTSKKEYSHINLVLEHIRKNNFKIKSINKNNKTLILDNKKIKLLTNFKYLWIIYEIFGDEIYSFKKNIDETQQYTIFDLGANRGYASIYFAQFDYIKDIYAFELVQQTYDFMRKNIYINPNFKNKIHLYNFGIGKEDKEIEIHRLEHRDGVNTINNDFLNNYLANEKGKGVLQTCELKKSSTIFKDIIEKNNIKDNIILKIDVEGAEYDIINDLVDNYSEFFNKVVKIVGETHLGFDKFYDKVKIFGLKTNYKKINDNGICQFEISKEI